MSNWDGRVAVCAVGRLGKITGRRDSEGVYTGTSLLVDKPWQSIHPRILSEQEGKLLEQVIEKAWMYDDLTR